MRDPEAHRPDLACASADRAARTWATVALVAMAVVLAGPALAQTNDGAAVRWDRPSPGTLQRGVIWVRRPTVVVALAGAIGAGVLGAGLYQRFRRRPPRS